MALRTRLIAILSLATVVLAGFFEVAGDEVMVVGFDVELLPFADAGAESVGFAGDFGGANFLAYVVVVGAEDGVCHGEIGIVLDGALEEGHGSGEVGFALHGFAPEAVGLERFERWRGRPFDWSIEFLDCF